jgi:hypothetical protein
MDELFSFRITYRTDLNTPPQLDTFEIEVPIRSKRKIDHIIDDRLLASIMFFLLARI